MSTELVNELTSSLINVDNLEEAQTQANLISTAGILITFFGLSFTGAVVGAMSTILGVATTLASNEIRRRIDEERIRRASLTSKDFSVISRVRMSFTL